MRNCAIRRTWGRLFCWGTGAILTLAAFKGLEPSASAQQAEPIMAVQSGDVTHNSAIIWARGDRSASSIIDISTLPNFPPGQTRRQEGPTLTAATDYTLKVDIRNLRPNTRYYYRVLLRKGLLPERLAGTGQLRTAPTPNQKREVSFIWAADLAGQGWGRNPDLQIKAFDGDTIRGGYVFAEVMGKLQPDFALLAGDMIYADNAIPPEQAIPPELGGGAWTNSPTKDLKAVTLDEFRANWKYNLGDDKYRNFLAQTPVYVQWDDHEVVNNWYPGEVLPEAPYNGISASELATTARQSFFEYNPIRGNLIYRRFRYGKHLELFLLDERSYRGPNPANTEESLEMLGENQARWLIKGLQDSNATWKVIASHDPLSIVTGGPGDYDAWGQGDTQVLGRETQLSRILQVIKRNDIRNVVFITADVHYAAALNYQPARATFKLFNPFWEFVIGPSHAGVFGPNSLDPSFGPEYEFLRAPGSVNPPLPVNSPPPYLHSFGSVQVAENGALTVRIHDISGQVIYTNRLRPQ